MKENEFSELRNSYVVKSNEIIQNGFYNLGLNEYKAVNYIIAKIHTWDVPNTVYQFDCYEFYALLGRKTRYNDIEATKKMIKNIADKTWFIRETDGTKSPMRWFKVIEDIENSPYLWIQFDKSIVPYLFGI